MSKCCDRRAFVGLVGGVSGSLLSGSVFANDNPLAGCDAVVSKSDGRAFRQPVYRSLAAALDAAPPEQEKPYRIFLAPGRYREKVNVSRPNVQIVGAGPERSVVYFDAAAGKLDDEGVAWGTFRSGTIIVDAPGFRASNLTIANTYGDEDGFDAETSGGRQAVALALNRGATDAQLHNLRVTGRQDTLFVDGQRAQFDRCFISGDVDFIFGAALALFRDCELQVRYRQDAEVQGYIAAPSTLEQDPIGFVFHACRLTREQGVPARSAFLGRPWRAGNNMSVVPMSTYLKCWMDDHIAADGWASMNYTNPEGERLPLMPEEVRFSEYGSEGPGFANSVRRRQLSSTQAHELLERALAQFSI